MIKTIDFNDFVGGINYQSLYDKHEEVFYTDRADEII